MRQEFLVTRWVVVLVVLAGAVWWLTSEDPVSAGSSPTTHSPLAEVAADAIVAAPATASWEAALQSPEIQALWRDRRRRLDTMSRVYRQTSDPQLAAALRCSMEALIQSSVREVYQLRLVQARRDGDQDLVDRLESDLAGLEPTPGTRPGGE